MMVQELRSHVKLSSRMDKSSCSAPRTQDAITVTVREDEDLPRAGKTGGAGGAMPPPTFLPSKVVCGTKF